MIGSVRKMTREEKLWQRCWDISYPRGKIDWQRAARIITRWTCWLIYRDAMKRRLETMNGDNNETNKKCSTEERPVLECGMCSASAREADSRDGWPMQDLRPVYVTGVPPHVPQDVGSAKEIPVDEDGPVSSRLGVGTPDSALLLLSSTSALRSWIIRIPNGIWENRKQVKILKNWVDAVKVRPVSFLGTIRMNTVLRQVRKISPSILPSWCHDWESILRRIKRHFALCGYDDHDICSRCGLVARTWWRVETGKSKNLTFKIASLLIHLFIATGGGG